MNVYGAYEEAKEDALQYLYPSGFDGDASLLEPRPDCPVHELLLNFILPKVEKSNPRK